MDKKRFFNFGIEVDKSEYVNFLSNKEDVLKENSNWLINIINNENTRLYQFQTKAEILITIYLGLLSVLLGSAIFGIFKDFINSNEGTILLVINSLISLIIFAYGLYKLVVVINPELYNVLDATLVLEKNTKRTEWLKKSICDCLNTYRKNLPKIETISFNIRTSIDCLIFTIFGITTALTFRFVKILTEDVIYIRLYVVLGVFVEIIILIIFIYMIKIRPRQYKENRTEENMMIKEIKKWKWELLIAGILVFMMIIDRFYGNDYTFKWIESFIFGVGLSLLFFMMLRKWILYKFSAEKLKRAKLIFKNSSEFMFFLALFAPTVYLGLIAMDLSKEPTINVAVDLIKHIYLFFLTYGAAFGCGVSRYFLTIYL